MADHAGQGLSPPQALHVRNDPVLGLSSSGRNWCSPSSSRSRTEGAVKRRLSAWAERRFRAHNPRADGRAWIGGRRPRGEKPPLRPAARSPRALSRDAEGGIRRPCPLPHAGACRHRPPDPGNGVRRDDASRTRAPEGFGSRLDALQAASIDAFVEESLRLSPPQTYLLRNAVRDTEIGGVEIKQGEIVCALTARAALDRNALRGNPWTVALDRPQDVYLHFGPENGPHRCFGRPIAISDLGRDTGGTEALGRRSARQDNDLCDFRRRSRTDDVWLARRKRCGRRSK